MKKLSFILAVFVIVFAASNSYSQNQVTVHVTGGYDLPMGDFKGTYPTDSNSYFQKSGFNAGADVKYYLGKKRNFGVTLSGGYHGFTSGDVSITGGGTAKDKINIIAIGLGAEWAFMPKGKANPFIGVEFTGNFFSGTSTFTDASGNVTSSTLNSAFNKTIGAVIGIKYNAANLIGKKNDTTGVTAGTYSLNDASFTNSAGTSVSAKNISYLQFYGGVAFFFGQPKKYMKK